MKLGHLSCVIASLLLSQAASANFSQTIFFGDSLTDTGGLKDIVNHVNPVYAEALQESFITNPDPAWSKVLANGYQKTAAANTKDNADGTNYAVGGARAGEDIKWNGLIPIPSTKKQIETHLAQNQNKADSQALYALWIGSNDLIAASQETDSLAALTKIQSAAKRAAADVQTLSQHGANYILVPNIPDISLTPRVIQAQAAGLAGIKEKSQLAATIYNKQLFTELNGTDANVIAADTFKLLQEVSDNPAAFGFKNTTDVACRLPERTSTGQDVASTSLACQPQHLVSPDANETYLFADDIHPAGRTHRILAQYYRSLIDAPIAMSKISDVVIADGSAMKDRLYHQVKSISKDGNNWWLDVGSLQSKNNNWSNEKNPAISLGVGYALGSSNIGVYAQSRQQNHMLDKQINADVSQLGLGVFYRHHGDVGVSVQAGVDRLNIRSERQVAWEGEKRIHQANGNGKRLYAAAQVDYTFAKDKWQVSPYFGIQAQKVRIDDLVEDQENLSTALRYHDQESDSLQAEVGMQAGYQLTNKIKLQGGAGYIREFNQKASQVGASLMSISQYTRGHSMSLQTKKRDYVHAQTQATLSVTNNTEVKVGLFTNRGHDSQYNTGAFVGLQGSF